MFESALQAQLKRIFELKKATFAAPGDAREQETLFIEVESARHSIKEGRSWSKVTGRVTVFGNSDKLPFGYFSKCIAKASTEDTLPLFFFDIEESSPVFQNIVARSFGFVFFFNSQYDPEIGTITSIDLQEHVE